MPPVYGAAGSAEGAAGVESCTDPQPLFFFTAPPAGTFSTTPLGAAQVRHHRGSTTTPPRHTGCRLSLGDEAGWAALAKAHPPAPAREYPSSTRRQAPKAAFQGLALTSGAVGCPASVGAALQQPDSANRVPSSMAEQPAGSPGSEG